MGRKRRTSIGGIQWDGCESWIRASARERRMATTTPCRGGTEGSRITPSHLSTLVNIRERVIKRGGQFRGLKIPIYYHWILLSGVAVATRSGLGLSRSTSGRETCRRTTLDRWNCQSGGDVRVDQHLAVASEGFEATDESRGERGHEADAGTDDATGARSYRYCNW